MATIYTGVRRHATARFASLRMVALDLLPMSSPAAILGSSGSGGPESFAGVLAARIQEETDSLSSRWLAKLNEILPVAVDQVFPGQDLLGHIPGLLHEVGQYLRAPETEEIGANTSVIEKARELGSIRHQQRASVHQLLREYEILGEVLEDFVAAETTRLRLSPSPLETIAVIGRLNRSIQILMRTTVDTFVGEFTTTIDQQTRRLESFNRTVSHELRNPLGTMQLAITLLRKQAQNPGTIDGERWLGVMQRNIDHMAQILQALESLTRAAGVPDTPSRQRISLEAVAKEVARQLEEMASARGVTIEVDPSLPMLHLDAARLELVLMNLVSNAVKYADPSKPERRVVVEHVAAGAPPGHRAIAVRDNGLGLAEAALERIFQPFFRAHAEQDTSLGNTGSGLGLAIVDECVRALGGTITVSSAAGAGTTFTVTLPDSDEMPG
jgi:signal transduction histidine kinase